MDKLEKVIKGFEHCKRESESIDDNPCNGCPYNYDGERGENVCMREQLMRDAIELLKEQENEIDTLKTLVLGYENGSI